MRLVHDRARRSCIPLAAGGARADVRGLGQRARRSRCTRRAAPTRPRRRPAQRDGVPDRQHEQIHGHDQAACASRKTGAGRSTVIGALAYRGCDGCVADSAVPPHVTPPTDVRRPAAAAASRASSSSRERRSRCCSRCSVARNGRVHVPPLAHRPRRAARERTSIETAPGPELCAGKRCCDRGATRRAACCRGTTSCQAPARHWARRRTPSRVKPARSSARCSGMFSTSVEASTRSTV